MRQLLRIVEGVAIALGAVLVFFIGFLQFEWVKQFLGGHAKVAAFIHSAWAVPIMIMCAVVVYVIQLQLKRPSLRVKALAFRIIPRVWDLPIAEVYAAERRNIDCDILVELHVVNESNTPVAIEEFECKLIGNKNKIKMPMTYVARLSDFRIRTNEGKYGDEYSEPPALTDKVANIALAQGIAYRGWVRFEVRQMEQNDGEKVQAKIFVVDTLGGKHPVKPDNHKPLDESIQILPVLDRHR
jgi:hypothetical protein